MSFGRVRESEAGRDAKGDNSLPGAAGRGWINSSTGGFSPVFQGQRNSLCDDEAEVAVRPEFLLEDNACQEEGWDEFASQDVEDEAYENDMRNDSVKAYVQSGGQSPALPPVLDNISSRSASESDIVCVLITCVAAMVHCHTLDVSMHVGV